MTPITGYIRRPYGAVTRRIHTSKKTAVVNNALTNIKKTAKVTSGLRLGVLQRRIMTIAKPTQARNARMKKM